MNQWLYILSIYILQILESFQLITKLSQKYGKWEHECKNKTSQPYDGWSTSHDVAYRKMQKLNED